MVISGKAVCYWTENRTRTVESGDNRRIESYSVSFSGEEIYLDSKIYLFGHRCAELTQMAPGSHKYIFKVDLPQLLPATIKGSHGGIEYKVHAFLDVPWTFDQEVKVPFTLVQNLNDYPELKVPLKQEEVKKISCFLCVGASCFITVSIPYGGYAVGQLIPIKIEYINQTESDIRYTNVKLWQKNRFKSSTPEANLKIFTEKIAEIIVDGAKKGETKNIECNLKIPENLMNSTGRFSRVVEVSYFLEIEGFVSGCHSDIKFHFPITIGSVGIGETSAVNQVPIADSYGELQEQEFTPLIPQAPQSIYTFSPTAPILSDVPYDDLRKFR